MAENEHVITFQEIEAYSEGLELFIIPNIGNTRWYLQREKIFLLSFEATLDVKNDREEVVKDSLVTFQKVPVLIHELIATELWRLKIFPILLQKNLQPKSAIPIYLVLFHEATILSLLEAVMFHDDVILSAEDALVDFVDYCYRNAIALKSFLEDDTHNQTDEDATDAERLVGQKREIQLECGIKCLSLLSFLAQHVKIFPLCVLHRILNVHDVPLLYCSMLENPPWIRQTNGQTERYEDRQWRRVEDTSICKAEGQIWIALIQLLLSPECQKKYEISGFKKDQLLKLRSKLNQVLFDQIPILSELLRFLEHLQIFDAPSPKAEIVIEQIPEIWECLRKEYRGKWSDIAEKQLAKHFSPSDSEMQSLCEKLTNSLNLDRIEALLPDTPKCAKCGMTGLKKCSRCKSEWYCGRPCQVSHWPKHQKACNIMKTE